MDGAADGGRNGERSMTASVYIRGPQDGSRLPQLVLLIQRKQFCRRGVVRWWLSHRGKPLGVALGGNSSVDAMFSLMDGGLPNANFQVSAAQPRQVMCRRILFGN
jgi:hypothetical protein